MAPSYGHRYCRNGLSHGQIITLSLKQFSITSLLAASTAVAQETGSTKREILEEIVVAGVFSDKSLENAPVAVSVISADELALMPALLNNGSAY